MDAARLESLAAAFALSSPLNHVRLERSGEALRLFDAPLIGCALADDPLFEAFLRPEVIGPHFRPPRLWLEGARTVVSFFLPFSAAVRVRNRAAASLPAEAWLYGRVEGQRFVEALSLHLAAALCEAGFEAVAPSLSPDFWTVSEPQSPGGPAFTSNWSERHVAFACGLGTFGLSRGLITRRGMAGRFGSLVTGWEAPPTPREYDGPCAWCVRCGACARRCPAGAISLDRGKDHHLCLDYQTRILPRCQPRFGCGLCQTGVPCEAERPPRSRRA